MFVVGLTGGIGCGKSTVAAEFAALGVPVIDTDQLAHALGAPTSPALPLIKQQFGEQAVLADGALNRAFIRDRVFADPQARRDLEAIMHPLILNGVKDWLAALPRFSPYAIVVVPLLFESPAFLDLVDQTVAVDCDEEEQIRRVNQRSGLAVETIRAIIAAQMPAAKRRDLADEIIGNRQSREALRLCVEKLHQKLALLAQTGT